MTTTIQAKFEGVQSTDLAPVDTYTGIFVKDVNGQPAMTFKSIVLKEPVHPSVLVRIFSEVGSDMGLDPAEVNTVIMGANSGHQIVSARKGAEVEDLTAFASSVWGFSNTKATARRAKRALKKGFGA